MNIIRALAIKILKYLNAYQDFCFPFLAVRKKHTPKDDNFVETEQESFIGKNINESNDSTKNFIFLTQEGITMSPKNMDTDNLQVLGMARGKSEEDAFKNFIGEYNYLLSLGFYEVIALELVNEKQYYFSLKNDIDATK